MLGFGRCLALVVEPLAEQVWLHISLMGMLNWLYK